MQNQNKELDDRLTSLHAKYSSLETVKNCLSAELDDVSLDIDKE